MSPPWRPQRTGNDILDRDLSVLMDIVSSLSAKIKTLSETKVQPVSVQEVKQLLNPKNLVLHFQAGGDAPLNIQGLLGVAGSAQIAGIPILNAVPTANDPHFINTAAVVVGGILYINLNGVFTAVSAGVTSITVSGGTTGLTGGTVTPPTGTITLAGTLVVANGGTGSTTASGARTNLGIDPIATKKSNLAAIVAPTVNDDNTLGYAGGSFWFDVSANDVYGCTNASTGAAVWKKLD